MSHKTEIITAVGTLACAVGIGFVMQSGEVAELRYGSASAVPIAPEALKVQSTLSLDVIEFPDTPFSQDEPTLAVSEITLTSADVETLRKLPKLEEPVLISTAAVSPLYQPAAPESRPRHLCPVKLSAEPFAAAMVKLTLTAPCMQNERVTVRHGGLEFTETTSASGGLDMTVPALSENAVFDITFVNDYTASVSAAVPSVKLYDRVAVQWEGNNTVQLHAREFGAYYGDKGHVWAGAMRDISVVTDGTGGFLTRHGDSAAANARLAEVYTYPVSLAQTKNALTLSIETEVTAANCGREVQATALKLMSGTVLPTRAVSLSVPGCSAIGNFLVLNNPLEDLTVATN
mgnify:CR=1 FL=1